jgi:hypothetical protein
MPKNANGSTISARITCIRRLLLDTKLYMALSRLRVGGADNKKGEPGSPFF